MILAEVVEERMLLRQIDWTDWKLRVDVSQVVELEIVEAVMQILVNAQRASLARRT